LALFMARVLADDHNPAFTLYYLAFVAHLFNAWSYFHISNPLFPVFIPHLLFLIYYFLFT